MFSTMIILVAVEIVCYLTTALFCFKIYVAVRNQIHVLQEQLPQNNRTDMGNVERERKAAVGTFYAYVVFLICYLPLTCHCIVHGSTGPSTVLWCLKPYGNTLVFLNSSLHPLIYTWKMTYVRHVITQII